MTLIRRSPVRGPGRSTWQRTLTMLAAAGFVGACGGAATPSPAPPSVAPPSSTTPSSPTPSPAASTPAGPTSDPSTWTLAWSDEFDGPAGTPPDAATWGYDLGDGSVRGLEGWGNREREYYTEGTANAATDGEGNLLITARVADGSLECWYGRCEYTSARLLTKGRFEIQYGRIEARIKVPSGYGLWPAFWMLGTSFDEVGWPKSGEIDIMEFLGRLPNEVLGTIHGPGYSGGSAFGKTLDTGAPLADDFHVFAIEWQPGHIAWFVDGVVYHEASPAEVAPNEWVFDQPFFLILNVAVGGNLAGPIFPDTAFPTSMAVDYVRLYQETTP